MSHMIANKTLILWSIIELCFECFLLLSIPCFPNLYQYLMISIIVCLSRAQLKVLAVTASNTWGLFLLVLLLGYGLVEVPRSLWNASRRGHTLAHTQFKMAKLSVEKSEAEEALEDVMDVCNMLSENPSC